jgi:osomolarity two-component system response regulator SKN7
MNTGSKYDLVLMDIIMPNLDGVSACHLIRQFDNTPIIAMTSNIRSDDISMYFQHGESSRTYRLYQHYVLIYLGMNDVLPKPFTKEGLLQMLEKHLAHLKKPLGHMDGIAAPQPLSATRQILKEEESPAKSPVTANWHSPNQMPGVSPAGTVGSSVTDEYMQAVHSNAATYPVNQVPPNLAAYNTSPQMAMQARQQAGHRRQISDISGGDNASIPAKRQQQMYAQPPLQPQPMHPMQRPAR